MQDFVAQYMLYILKKLKKTLTLNMCCIENSIPRFLNNNKFNYVILQDLLSQVTIISRNLKQVSLDDTAKIILKKNAA